MAIDQVLNERIIGIYEFLHKEGRVKTKAEFCQEISFHPVSWAKVEGNFRTFPKGKFKDLSHTFGVSPYYLTDGTQPMFAKADARVRTIKTKDLVIDKNDKRTIIKFTDEDGIDNVLELLQF